nr:MAG TPA: hypothetical protein [Caudoviricetes sp.]
MIIRPQKSRGAAFITLKLLHFRCRKVLVSIYINE